MEHYFVDYKLHNSENDGWAFKTEAHSANYDDMLKKFYAICNQYINTNPFDHVVVILSDAFGNQLKKEVWTKVVEPEVVEE